MPDDRILGALYLTCFLPFVLGYFPHSGLRGGLGRCMIQSIETARALL